MEFIISLIFISIRFKDSKTAILFKDAIFIIIKISIGFIIRLMNWLINFEICCKPIVMLINLIIVLIVSHFIFMWMTALIVSFLIKFHEIFLFTHGHVLTFTTFIHTFLLWLILIIFMLRFLPRDYCNLLIILLVFSFLKIRFARIMQFFFFKGRIIFVFFRFLI
jgi:hypothetical protein